MPVPVSMNSRDLQFVAQSTSLHGSLGVTAGPQPSLHGGLGGAAGKSVVLPFLGPVIRGGLPPRALRRVIDYIEAHLEKNISIQVLAEIAGLSMFHFARTFKQSEGMTPHDYVIRCRVRRAQDLLATTDMPLSEIALASGFSDQSHCARRFREELGITPSQYRRSMR